MTPGRCKHCRWWQVPFKEGDEHDFTTEHMVMYPMSTQDDDAYGRILPVEFPVGKCGSPGLVRFARPRHPDTAALMDGSEYYAALWTGPEFGCVNWEGKTDDGR